MKENNELIAEFMGFFAFESMPVSGQKIYKLLDLSGNPIHPYYGPFRSEQMQFDRSWDWIHPVVDRISSLMPSINIPEDLEALKNGTHGSDPYIDVISMSISSPINEIYEAIVKFIKWYNTTQQ